MKRFVYSLAIVVFAYVNFSLPPLYAQQDQFEALSPGIQYWDGQTFYTDEKQLDIVFGLKEKTIIR